jgi:pimeloyl-ACP methyl ester carboxylesterase
MPIDTPPPLSGPVQAALLADLAPTFTERFAESGEGPLRVLEGGEGSPLVLLHGRGHAAITWFPLLPALARRHRVLAVDLPGFGRSAAPRFEGAGFEAGAAYFAAPIEAWLTREGIAAPALIGHSLGGLCAVELALRRRIEPRRLVLIGGMGLGSAMSYASRLFFRVGPERLARQLGATLFGRLLGERDTEDNARAAALNHELHAARRRRFAARAFNALYPALGPVPHRLGRLGEIEAPVLVLWGDRDEVFPAPVAIAAAAAFPHAELRIEPLGHSPHIEAPERVLPAILEFLEDAGSPDPALSP